ncbi:hypothetical protein BLNAU_8704 [Blattamonas nauphoetae]|uniref:Uncharacterized protein n=1 Tax=Blattamonas nauphoetae TaxID=2049346 RepID=A0ABQ9XXV9_9EUKA|nr:hypothetical protein BLNAU_8704 [Blattamonas nauphoetae]
MDFVLRQPVVLTIPSNLTYFDSDATIRTFLYTIANVQREWNEESAAVGQRGKIVHRVLRMEGIEDVLVEKLQNDNKPNFGWYVVDDSRKWNNQQGMNIPEQE